MLIQNQEGRIGRLHYCGLKSTFGWLKRKPIITVDLGLAVLDDLGSLDGCEEWPSVCQIIVKRQYLMVRLAAGKPNGFVQFCGTFTGKLNSNRQWLANVAECEELIIIINPHLTNGQLFGGRAIVCSQIIWGRDQLAEKSLLILPGWSFGIKFSTPVEPPVILMQGNWRNMSGNN